MDLFDDSDMFGEQEVDIESLEMKIEQLEGQIETLKNIKNTITTSPEKSVLISVIENLQMQKIQLEQIIVQYNKNGLGDSNIDGFGGISGIQ